MTSSTAGRRSRVEGTETRILAAARELFIAQGYQDTTLSAVADRAGVGARTVYLRFGSKGAVLLRAAEVALGGPVGLGAAFGEPVAVGAALDGPVATLGEPAAVRESPDLVAAFARVCRTRYERLGGLVRVLDQASATEPFVADAVAKAGATNRRAAAELVGAMHTAGRLSPGVDPVQASETVAVLGAGEAWLALSEAAGWDADRYERWLADTIRRVLLG